MFILLSLYLICKSYGLVFIIEPIRRDPFLEPHKFCRMSYDPCSRVGVAVSNFNAVPPYEEFRLGSGIPESGIIPDIRSVSDILHIHGGSSTRIEN